MIKLFKLYNCVGFFIAIIVCGYVLSTTNVLPAAAQSLDEPWAPPNNLSHSGATDNPVMIVDSSGIVHVIWEDEFSGWIYTRLESDIWSTPIAAYFPFEYIFESEESSHPRLIPDTNGRIHAFWTDEEDVLFYSSVESSSFNDPLSWQAPQQIAQSAVDIDIAIDTQGNMHLVYVRAIDDDIFPAGIYYRYLTNGGL